jgi:hypothetical protein
MVNPQTFEGSNRVLRGHSASILRQNRYGSVRSGMSGESRRRSAFSLLSSHFAITVSLLGRPREEQDRNDDRFSAGKWMNDLFLIGKSESPENSQSYVTKCGESGDESEEERPMSHCFQSRSIERLITLPDTNRRQRNSPGSRSIFNTETIPVVQRSMSQMAKNITENDHNLFHLPLRDCNIPVFN